LDKEDLFVLQIKSEIEVESWDDNTQKTSKIGRLARLPHRGGQTLPPLSRPSICHMGF